MLRCAQKRSTKSVASSNKRSKADLGVASLGSEDKQNVTISKREHELGKAAIYDAFISGSDADRKSTDVKF